MVSSFSLIYLVVYFYVIAYLEVSNDVTEGPCQAYLLRLVPRAHVHFISY